MSAVQGRDDFERLHALHEAAVGFLDQDRLDELTPGMRALTVLFVVVGTIDNGGFAACMYNSSGSWTGDAIEAARLVGATGHAVLLERFAETALGGDARMSDEARNERLEAMGEAADDVFEQLDEAFYALPEIDGFLTAHVEANPEQFFRDEGSTASR
jgi:hypothetical protein